MFIQLYSNLFTKTEYKFGGAMNYILTEESIKTNGEEKFHAGGKAVQDIICESKNDWKPLYIVRFDNNGNPFLKLLNLFTSLKGWINVLFKVRRNDFLLIQCPMRHRMLGRNTIQKYLSKRTHIISLIHDVEQLREDTDHNAFFEKEIEFAIETSEILIVHNVVMEKWFISNGFEQKRIVNLELFDYLTNSDYAKNESNGIIIAGNFNKSPFVHNLSRSNGQFELYGIGYRENYSSNCNYHGAIVADALPEALNGKWGLVWDGISVETCDGSTGKYLKYNNPHKMSLYIASGLPIIIWSGAAQADFVNKYQIGISVDSLTNIQDTLDTISMEQYCRYKENAMNLSKKVRNGYFFKKSIAEAIDLITRGGGIISYSNYSYILRFCLRASYTKYSSELRFVA